MGRKIILNERSLEENVRKFAKNYHCDLKIEERSLLYHKERTFHLREKRLGMEHTLKYRSGNNRISYKMKFDSESLLKGSVHYKRSFFKKLFSIDEFKISPYTNKEGFKAKLKCLTKGFSSFSINVGDRFCFQTTDFSVDYDLWLKARKMFKDLISVERRK